MSTRWRIELLGGLGAESGSRVINRFYTQKMGALLAYLAYHLQRPHPREALIDLLWPEADPQAGRNSLSVALSSLRHQLEPPGVPAGTIILADRVSVRLNPDSVTTDVAEFHTALQAVERAESRTERAMWLGQAVEMYRGELLPGAYEEWVLQERGWLAQRYFQALGQFLAHLEEAGEVGRAVEYARAGVRADPLREEAHQALIRLLIAAGQGEAAQRQYRELERLLREELGATPGAATRALVASLRDGATGRQGDRATQRVEPGVPTRSPSRSPHRPVAPSPRRELPSGTVTFLLTDIEGSTALWERARDAFAAALESHHALLRREFRRHGGYEVKEMGDAFLVAFERATDALASAVAGQRALASHRWPDAVGPLQVRMALHTADVEPQEGDYHGLALHHAQRMLAAGHGGQILCSEATAALLRRSLEPGVRLTDLGVYRLRDVTAPERLFQVEYPEMARREFPPLKAEAGHAHHLPLSLTRFFGRDKEVALLGKLLLSQEWRLVTLMGPGGSGKTRLALESARRLVEEWRCSHDRPPWAPVWFVSLADLAEAPQISEAIRDAMRLSRSPDVEPLEQVIATLSRQPSLLVLDNFEHLVDEGAPLVQTLLEQVPSLTCLVTSRQRLNLPGEREFLVPALPTPEPSQTPEQLIQCESVQLFVDRAQAVRPDFQVTSGNAAAVAALCQRLEGIPLALELAAARTQVLTPAQMLERLERRFELLVGRQRGVSRQRSLRAALDWGYELLSPELQQFFARLCRFQGGWDLDAAEAVCDEPLALDYLAQLRECSLVLAEESSAEIRFRMLETLREYAREQLPADELAALEERHAAHYLALAEQAEPELRGAAQGEWLERLEREHGNLRVALAWSVARGRAEVGLRLGRALWRFWEMRGHLKEGRERLAQLLALPEAQARTAARAAALNGAGALAYDQGDFDAAQALYEESLQIRRELGDQRGMAGPLHNIGNIALSRGEYAAARAAYEESLAVLRELGDRSDIATTLESLGNVAHYQGDPVTARPLYEESLAIRRELGDRYRIASSLVNLGNAAKSAGDYHAARKLYEESLTLLRELGERYSTAILLNSLGMVERCQGDLEAARALHEESLAIFRELGVRPGIAGALAALGNVAHARGDLVASRALHEESLALRRELGDKSGIASSLLNLGSVAHGEGEYRAARALYDEGLAIFREVSDRSGIAASFSSLAKLAHDEGDAGAARALYRDSLAIFQELGNRLEITEALEGLAAVARSQAQPERAARLFGAAAALREAIGAPLPPAEGAEVERQVTAARTALGEEAFTAAWAAGRGLALEQAVALASEEGGGA